MIRSIFQSRVSAAKSQALGGVQRAAKKAYFKYVLIFSLLLLLYPAFCFLKIDNILSYFIGFQIWAIILGAAHIWQMGKRFDWKNIHSFWEKLEISIMIMLVSAILTGALIGFLPYSKIKDFWLLFPSGVLLFILPLLTVSVFDFAIDIPPEEYKLWFYPEKEIPDPDTIDFTDSYVLAYELYKKEKDTLPTVIRWKAPLNVINFGDLFYMYLYEYNDRNRENPIEYMDSTRRRYGWLFYVKPDHWWNSKKIIDPTLTVKQNNIQETGIIVPYRL